MKKAFKTYLVAWAIMFVLFNAVVIFLPQEFKFGGLTYEKFGGYSLVTLLIVEACFLLHVAATAKALNQKKLSGTFYRLPLIRISYGCVVLTTLVAVVGMTVFIDSFIPPILLVLILAFYLFALLRAEAAVTLVEGVENKVQARTAFVRTFTADTQSLMAKAGTPEAKALCKKVYEAARYSDPMSNSLLKTQEQEIWDVFALFSQAVQDGGDQAAALCDQLLGMIAERNNRCKSLK